MTDLLQKRYELETSPVPAMAWETYHHRAMSEWHQQLADNPGDEPALHRFLERHPSLLPGAFGYPESSGHYPLFGTVISEPPLQGITSRVPDFLWLAQNSAEFMPVMVEIETPNKPWFTQGGQPSAKLTQAQNQLTEWREWFNKPANVQVFMDFYQVSDEVRRHKRLVPKYVLIYGSRSEFQKDPPLRGRRAAMMRDGEAYMTFDGLEPQYKARDMFCCRVTSGHYEALTVPATFKPGPQLADYHSRITQRPQAISANEWIDPERRDFLIRRLPYWDEYARLDSQGMYSMGDAE
ncbi:MAG: Shedu anti-phage system protein SduA domain-containing protein [Chloroflexota bacterium]